MHQALPRVKINFNENGEGFLCIPGIVAGFTKKLVKRLERQEKQLAYQQGRFFKYKLDEIHGKLKQTLLQEEIIGNRQCSGIFKRPDEGR